VKCSTTIKYTKNEKDKHRWGYFSF
jgi:hypothetical protein